MKHHTIILIPCVLLPIGFAIGLSLWATTIDSESSSLMLTAIPCGLLGLAAALIIALIRSLDDRLQQLQRSLDDKAQRDDSPLPKDTH